MSTDEADPESSSVMQLQKSSGSDGDAKDSAETKDSTMQLLAKMLGHPTEMEDVKETGHTAREESDFDDGLDFYQISFDEVDDRISAFQEDEFVKDALEKGMDLRQYARQVENEMQELQSEHENDYTNNIRSFINLHQQFEASDEILGNMEDMLDVFQTDLGNISREIKNLQERSTDINIKLKNRKIVEGRLGSILDNVVVAPHMIRKITESDVDDVWLQYLLELNKKMRFVKANQNKPIRALQDIGPELEKLRLKAASTIRDFFVNKIISLRIPNTNIQILQQSVFLKYKALYHFVTERHHEAATEIRQTYINTMRWYFYNHFDRYHKGLVKLQSHIADKTDLIGVEESVKKGGLFSSGKSAIKDKTNVFALGDRIETLRAHDAGVILVHIAEDEGVRYPFEQLFRSFNLTLIDNASSEYLFISEFFANNQANNDTAKLIFQHIFTLTEDVGLTLTKSYVEHSYDAVGILLCVRINTQLMMELQRRRVPTMDNYLNATNMLFWPRYQHIMDMHVDSIRKMASTKSVLSAVKDIHPHYVTRRYAEFATSVLTLNDGYDDSNVTNSLQRLRNEFEGLLSRMSNELPDTIRKIAFLINNYDLIVSVMNESANRAVSAELEHVDQILSLQKAAFVEEQLKPFFGDIIDCVNSVEQQKSQPSEFSAAHLEKISTHFAQTWRQSLSAINTSVIQYFSNFKNGTTVLHAALGQVIIYYTKFIDLLEKRYSGQSHGSGSTGNSLGIAGWKVQPVGVQTVMVAVKSFRSTF
ncbi:Vacuolar protein sorting-associated protein 52 [Umbelopsis nana]